MIKKIKQMFCFHKYEEIKVLEDCGFDLGGIMVEVEERTYLLCNKCGNKIRKY